LADAEIDVPAGGLQLHKGIVAHRKGAVATIRADADENGVPGYTDERIGILYGERSAPAGGRGIATDREAVDPAIGAAVLDEERGARTDLHRTVAGPSDQGNGVLKIARSLRGIVENPDQRLVLDRQRAGAAEAHGQPVASTGAATDRPGRAGAADANRSGRSRVLPDDGADLRDDPVARRDSQAAVSRLADDQGLVGVWNTDDIAGHVNRHVIPRLGTAYHRIRQSGRQPSGA